MRSDPSDNGGLFMGRRPGTAPVHFRNLPERGSPARQRIDKHMAELLFAAITVLMSALLGADPTRLPVGCLAGQLPHGQRQPRHPARVRRTVRAALGRAAGHARARPDVDPGAPRRRLRPALGRPPAHLRGHGRDLRSGVHDLVRLHPRTWCRILGRQRGRVSRVAAVIYRPRLSHPRRPRWLG